MKCPSCGFENKSGVKFCGNCGSPLQNTCPNCGTVNAAGARFCTSCGLAIGAASPAPAASPQPVVVVKQGTSGWVWALIGILIGVIVIGGLVLGDILPLDFFETTTSSLPSPTEAVAVAPVIASTRTPTAPVSGQPYCPQSGGVILYWNAGYDCTSESGDPGYRYRVGDGAQDVNTGQFDNQASAIYIPAGWSVRLYENAGQKGRSVCFNSPVPNFEERGNFPGGNLPINDNVSSMRVFADGTCGEDLAAGAKPAPWPKKEKPIEPPGAANPEDVRAADVPCIPGWACECLPTELVDVMEFPPDEEGKVPWWLSEEEFREKYIDTVVATKDSTSVTFKPEFKDLWESLEKMGMQLKIDVWDLDRGSPEVTPPCFTDHEEGTPFSCEIQIEKDLGNPNEWEAWIIEIYQQDETGHSTCAQVYYSPHTDHIFNLGELQPVLQCTNPHKPQVCGDQCCNKDDKCVQRGGVWKCDKPPGPQSGCSSSLGPGACAAAGGTWDSWSSSCSCP